MPPPTTFERLSAALAGRYEVECEVGAGGMGTVFRARDLQVGRRVAVKVLSPEHRSEVSPARFLSEIRTAANLQHPHIVPLFDAGDADGLLYYTMPYIDGVTLQQRIAKGPLSVDEATSILREVGSGLAYAHRQGFLHRDIKPANVLLSGGHALLADFGLARAMETTTSEGLTRTGTLLGTTLYMSPEQASGAEDLDRRSDLYSLGCVAYHMLAGEPPYVAAHPLAVITAHMMSEVPSVVTERPDVPVEMAQVIERSMAKQPVDRFDSVDEFIGALTGEVAVAAPSRWKTPRRRWPLFQTVAAVGGTVSGVALLAVLFSRGPSAAPTTSPLVPERVVVAPLENATGEDRLGPVGRLAADMITEGLHRTGIVDVVPSLTALQASQQVQALIAGGGGSDAIRELAYETSAGKVISGSYYLDGDALLFQLQVTDAVTGRLIDALNTVRGSPTAPSEAVNELRSQVMGALAVSLDDRLADIEVRQIATPDYTAYEAFDEGMEQYLASDWTNAAASFSRAFSLDTTFVLALHYGALSNANIGARGRLEVMDSLAGLLDARRGELADYHVYWLDYTLARARGRNQEALAAIREAAALAPSSKAVYNYAYASQLNNRPRAAVEALRTLDPERGPMRGWFPYWQMLTDNLHRLGEHSEELAAARRARELHPDLLWSYRQEGEALAAREDVRRVRALMDEMLRVPFAAEANVGSVYTTVGSVLLWVARELRFHDQPDEADELLRRSDAWYRALDTDAREQRANKEPQIAVLHELGRREEAKRMTLELLEEHPDDTALLGALGIIEAWLGNVDEAERISGLLQEAERRDPYSRGEDTLSRAMIAGSLGQADRAAELLAASIAEGARPLRHADFNLGPVADDPAVIRVLSPQG